MKLRSHFYVDPIGIYDTPCNFYEVYNDKYFLSGAITVKDPSSMNHRDFSYGYFEIECKLPVHAGAFPAFWLYGHDELGVPGSYREIDIFEWEWHINPSSRSTNGQIYYRVPGDHPVYGQFFHTLPSSEPDLTTYHTFGAL